MATEKHRRKSRKLILTAHPETELFLNAWLALSPRERLRRSWRQRRRLPDPQAIHDAKIFPKP